MAGAKKPVNIFKLNRGDDPKEVLNWRLWFAVVSFGLMGAARGVDEGLISGTFASKHFQNQIGYNLLSTKEQSDIKANVSAMVQIGSVGGALIAFLLCDRIGRLWATRQLCVVWILGIVIFMANNGHIGAVYAGRFIAGLGIGQTTVVAPVYLAEISPASVRGLCTCFFSGAVYIGIMLAYFSSWGASIHMGENFARWEVPTSLHLMFATIILVLSFFNYESPRFLVKVGKDETALANLARIRGLPQDHPHVLREINAIQVALHEEQEATMGQGWLGYVKEMFLNGSNFYRIYIGLMGQILSQWSGAGSITLYAPDFFKLLGVTGQNEKLFATAIFGLVKFIAAVICALFLVDFIGRKRSLMTGITLQAISMIYIAAYLTATPELQEDPIPPLSAAKKHAGTGAIAMIYISGFGWAMGWNSMQYLLTAELYPLRIRAVSTSVVMCFHFANQYGNSRAVPSMLNDTSIGGITPAGTFWCFAAITILGLGWVWFTIPETAGRTLESMDRLFSLPWYKIGRYGNKVAAEQDVIANEKQTAAEEQDGTVRQIEETPRKTEV